MSAPTVDLLSLIADDKSVVTYRPRWNQLTGSITATILLQQLIYRWIQSGRRPFYKFTGPCNHPLCRPGDTWEEELGLTRREFETARARIAGRTQGDIADDSLVSYWMTTGHCTWYAINEPLLIERLAALYPTETESVGVQLRLPSPKPFHKSANGDGGIVEWRSTNPPMAMAESSNGNGGNVEWPTEPFNKNANAIGGIRQQINKDDLTDHEEQRPTETTETTAPPASTPPEAEPPAPAGPAGGGAADVPTILRWVNFTDRLNAHEQAIPTPPTALAWCYFIHLEEAKPTRPKNAVGLARSRWRSTPPAPPPADLLALAQFWLALADNGRRALLDRLGFTARFGTDDDLDDDFPGLPVAAAIAVYRATGGELAPPSLTPVRESTAAAIAEVRAGPSRSVAQTAPPQPTAAFWRDALAELEMQMTRATFTQLLAGATATLTDDQLTVHVRNHYAADWLSNRLHDLITRTVAAIAGRPIAVHYEVSQ